MAADILKRTEKRISGGGNQISMSKLIRGMSAEGHTVLNRATMDEDIAYARAFRHRRTGSYLVPTLQAMKSSRCLRRAGFSVLAAAAFGR